MKKLTCSLLLAFLVLIPEIVFSEQMDMAEIIKRAKQEGEVTWTSTLKEKEAEPFVKAFSKEYPGIKVTHTRASGGRAMERLVRELTSGGKSVDDVVQIHGDYEQEFMNMNVIQRVNWKIFNVEPQLIHRDSRLLGIFTLPYVFVYNSKLVKKDEAPKTWNDFLDPKWKGKFVVDSRPSSLLFLASTWGQEKVLEYTEKLGKNKPIFLRGQTRTMTLMAAGEYTISATAYLSTAIFVNQKGAPLEWNIPEVVPLNWGNFAILNGVKHPNAAKVFLGWMGSKGYKMMDSVNWGRSAPFGGTRTENLFAGKRLSFPPSYEQVPSRQKLLLQISKNLGLRN